MTPCGVPCSATYLAPAALSRSRRRWPSRLQQPRSRSRRRQPSRGSRPQGVVGPGSACEVAASPAGLTAPTVRFGHRTLSQTETTTQTTTHTRHGHDMHRTCSRRVSAVLCTNASLVLAGGALSYPRGAAATDRSPYRYTLLPLPLPLHRCGSIFLEHTLDETRCTHGWPGLVHRQCCRFDKRKAAPEGAAPCGR